MQLRNSGILYITAYSLRYVCLSLAFDVAFIGLSAKRSIGIIVGLTRFVLHIGLVNKKKIGMDDHCDKENVTSSSDSQPFLKFIPLTSNKPVVKKESENDQHPVLVLKHFADIPKLYFEKVKVGRTKSISLTIVNPSSHEHQIKIAKISELKGFTVNTTSLCIQPQSQYQLEITWIPKIAGTVRDTLVLMSQNSHRLHVILHGTAVESPHKVLNSAIMKVYNILPLI